MTFEKTMEEFDRKTPAGAVGYFRNCLKNGNAEGALSCFDSQGVYIDRNGEEMKGLVKIEVAMKSLCILKPSIVGTAAHVTLIGDLAMWLDKWTMTGKTPNGHPLEMKGHTSCILKRNEAGIWLWLVDNPFGAAILED
jgi:ketosteroid isomerase-like protein